MNPSARDAGLLIRDHVAAGPVSLLAVLDAMQGRYHYLPHSALVLLSQALDIPLSQIYSVATFYNAYSLKPRGKHLVRVCMGTACHVRGSPRVLDRLEKQLGVKPGETTRDKNVTLETVNCLGACALGPIVVADSATLGEVDIARTDRLLKQLARE